MMHPGAMLPFLRLMNLKHETQLNADVEAQPSVSARPKPRQPVSARALYNATATAYRSRFAVKDRKPLSQSSGRAVRNQTYAKGAADYYEIITTAYLQGWGSHFHFCPFAPRESIHQAITFYEHKLAFEMGLQPGMKVLDVGCGVGGPAREIAKFVGCEIVGVNISQLHVDMAMERTAQEGLSHLCTFVKGDFCHLTDLFAPESFDAAYGIESTVHAPELAIVYSQISRVLKPGAPVGISEWVMTEAFQETDANHTRIRDRIERGCGVSHMDTIHSARRAMQEAGFDVRVDADFSRHWDYRLKFRTKNTIPEASTGSSWSPVTFLDKDGERVLAPGPAHPVYKSLLRSLPSESADATIRPWYYPLIGNPRPSSNMTDWWLIFKMSHPVRSLWYWSWWILVQLRILPRGVLEAMQTMVHCVDSCVEGGQEGIFSPCWWLIGIKQRNPHSMAPRGFAGHEVGAPTVAAATSSGASGKSVAVRGFED